MVMAGHFPPLVSAEMMEARIVKEKSELNSEEREKARKEGGRYPLEAKTGIGF